jgi:glycerophosphoryl diester phosphodiesterase
MYLTNTKPIRNTFDAINRNKIGRKPYIESHRGCNKEEPENTLAAFKRAIEYNCDSIELDIWLSKDNIPMVIHCTEEGNISETTNGDGLIYELSHEELQKYEAGKNEPIPVLSSVLSLCKDKIFINIEIKDKNYELCIHKVIALVNEHEMDRQIAISSFKHEYWEEINKLNQVSMKMYNSPRVEFGFLYDVDQFDYIFDRPNSTINLWYKNVNSELVKKAHESNMGVHVWFMMNDVETDEIYEYLFVCGVDIICSNHPNRVLEIRDKVFSTCI